MQDRMPGVGRYGGVQSRISGELLRDRIGGRSQARFFGHIHEVARLASIGAASRQSFAVERRDRFDWCRRAYSGSSGARVAAFRPSDPFARWFELVARASNPTRPRSCCSPTPLTISSSPRSRLPRPKCSNARGFASYIPQRDFCCGRPLYDQGMLDAARRAAARHALTCLTPFVERGVNVVGLEPSCFLTLRDELPALFRG